MISAWLVHILAAVGHFADAHSTAIGLANGRVELNPIARALSTFVTPLASVIGLKLFAFGVTIVLLRRWADLDNAGDFWLPVVFVGVLSLCAATLGAWHNYA